jgi:hypothetical protein
MHSLFTLQRKVRNKAAIPCLVYAVSGVKFRQRNGRNMDCSVATIQQLSSLAWHGRLAEEVRYIQRRASERSGRIVTIGPLLVFSTEDESLFDRDVDVVG